MKDTERRGYEMLVRVSDFGTARTAAFPSESAGGQLLAALNVEIDIIEVQAGAQTSGFNLEHEGTATRSVARDSLRAQMEAMSRTATSLAHTTPGLENRFRMPRGNNDQALINAARAFARDAAPLTARFVSFGLAPNFIANLETTITELEQAINRQNTGRETHVAATTSLNAALERGIRIVRQLDAIVRNKFQDDEATLAAWTSASRIERTRRRNAAQPPATPPAP